MTRLEFTGKGFEYFKIWIVNIMLTIVTFGIYYPWAKVRNLRYFYGNTSYDNRNFDYHATGKQLFLGYLIAVIALLVYITAQSISPALLLVVTPIVVIAAPWVVWRSLKFSLRMTSFSNVRLGFNGNLIGSYSNYLILPILFAAISYGLPFFGLFLMMPSMGEIQAGEQIPLNFSPVYLIAIPIYFALIIFMFAYMKKRNASYTINGLTYGQGQFSAKLKTAAFIKITLKAMLLVISGIFFVSIISAITMGTSGISEIMASAQANPEARESIGNAAALSMALASQVLFLGLIVISICAYAYSYTRRRAYIYQNTKLDNQVLFKSTLKARTFAWVSITNLLIMIITLGLGTPWAKVRTAKLLVENTAIKTNTGFDTYLTKQEEYQSSIGDQLGDVFDVDVGIGI